MRSSALALVAALLVPAALSHGDAQPYLFPPRATYGCGKNSFDVSADDAAAETKEEVAEKEAN